MLLWLPGDKCAASGVALDQTFNLDTLQGDADCRSTDVQMPRQLRLGGNPFSIPPASGHNQPPQLVMKLYVQRDVAVMIQPDLFEFVVHVKVSKIKEHLQMYINVCTMQYYNMKLAGLQTLFLPDWRLDNLNQFCQSTSLVTQFLVSIQPAMMIYE